MGGTGQGGRFSLSGRYCGVEQGTHMINNIRELVPVARSGPQLCEVEVGRYPSHLVVCYLNKIDDILVYRTRERSSAKTYTRGAETVALERERER